MRRHRRKRSQFPWGGFRKGPRRPPRVTDDDDDGLAGALVPRKPFTPKLSGGAALPIPVEDRGEVTALAISR
jgi:hypothetical protein